MENQVWYHFKIDTITNDVGKVQSGRAPKQDLKGGDLVIAMEPHYMYLEFWVPGTADTLRGQEIYVFGAEVGWASAWHAGLIGHLESAFPKARNIQEKIKDVFELEFMKFRPPNHEEELFLDELFTKDQQILSVDDEEAYDVLERAGLHEDYAWSYLFRFFAKVRLP